MHKCRFVYLHKNNSSSRTFQCGDLTLISQVFLCDGKRQCSDGGDEADCSLSLSYLCKSILKYDLLDKYKLLCPIPWNKNKQISPVMYPGKEACSNNTESVQNTSRCIYNISAEGHIDFDPCGGHLTSCRHHKCPDMYYKCPGFYCIPWRYVCDGIIHCPGGMEEKVCDRKSCPGQFHCYEPNSNIDSIGRTICIHHESLCDAILDCPYGDDELFCESRLPNCPVNCSCVLFSMSCIAISAHIFSDKCLWHAGLICCICFSHFAHLP